MKFVSLLLAIFLIAPSSTALASKSNQSYKAFGHLPMIKSPKVSPDGKYVAAIFNSPDGPQVVISEFGSSDITTIVKLRKAKDRIESITWANNNRLLVGASYSKKWAEYRYRINRLFAVDRDGNNLKELKARRTKSWEEWMDFYSDVHIRAILKNDEEHVILQTYDQRDKANAVFKVNINTNNFEKLFVNKYDVYSWIANEKGEIVLGIGGDEDNPDITNIWHRADAEKSWSIIQKIEAFKSDTFNVQVVKGDKAYVISNRELGRDALWLYNIKSGQFEEMIYAHDKFDIDSVILSRDKTEVIGVYYFDHFHQTHYFNQKESKLQRIVKKSFKSFKTSIFSMDLARKKVMIRAMQNNSPDKFYWLDLANKKAGLWFSQFPYIEGKTLASTESFEFTTQDGMKLNGYITKPAGSEGKKLPLVVNPHGGPIGIRDYQYFDPYVQFMANMGYAVLQVNYRGSGGFGTDYETAGYRQWGKKMQTDVYEAIDWVGEQGIADISNSCVVGHSYGGYFALTAAFQRPEQFKCIVSIAGVSDLNKRAEKLHKNKGSRSFIVKTMADHTTEKGAKDLEQHSPINFVEKIKAPILLIHGQQDTQAYYKQSSDFYEVAEDAGVDVEYIEFKHGTHYLDENENRLKAFEELGEFLTEHLN